ncbi:hypothetical protein M4I21_17850 [Cellulophaga sp. 20_2_10]|uniref:hypothetical protein n=1 Tax=Cellulophaga sp. 20_2_10 TaxID=2942476 RepID=UPI00201A87FB|nr:hypothetical protein [Cellulophaga sp. 20_2_10]MCL5247681.1 hypothetical protein [Cellulophaga sp. 20_2_10]
MGSIIVKAKNLQKIVEENYITKVGNKLTKTAEEVSIYTTEGSINMYSNTSIDIKGEEGTTLGEYQEPPALEPETKTVVNFRPKTDWKGDNYGFDWMRADIDEKRLRTRAGTKPQKPYNDIVGKYYEEAAFTTLTTEDAYKGKHFKTVLTEYNTLKNTEYKGVSTDILMKEADNTTPLANGSKQNRYEAWLSLYPKQIKDPSDNSKLIASGYTKNTKALLSLVVNTDEAPDRYAFEANDNFTINLNTIPTSIGRQVLNDHLTIECEKEFDTDQKLELYAYQTKEDGSEDKKLAGVIKVWANDNTKCKKAKIVLVAIKTPIFNTNIENEAVITDQKDLIENYTLQALIETEVVQERLDLSTDPKFNPQNTVTIPSLNGITPPISVPTPGIYTHNTGSSSLPSYSIKCYYSDKYTPSYQVNPNKPTGFISVHDYLFDKLRDKLELEYRLRNPKASSLEISNERKKYDNQYIAFYFGEKGGNIKFDNSYSGLNGYASGKKIVLFSSKNNQTTAHEFLHAFNLPHTHVNKEADSDAKYTYEYSETDNLVGYAHHKGVERRSLWKWQWEKANNSIV